MVWDFAQISVLFSEEQNAAMLKQGTFGLEKETQRTTAAGDLALTDHPTALGDKFTNEQITTDFAESQLELITPPFKTLKETYEFLKELQAFVEVRIGDELLWPLSMPPRLPADADIPVARYNDSMDGKEKEVYRNGLALRYGKKMQMISGLHFNFSFGDEMIDYLYTQFGNGEEKQAFVNALYAGVTRNFLRYRWLLIYLFGASPSVDDTYYPVIYQELKTIGECCPECGCLIDEYERYATSLRVSRFGYSNTSQREYNVPINTVEEYIQHIRNLLATKSEIYTKLGIHKDGLQIQLNDNVLQKESEFYSPIRFKQVTKNGETQLEALEKRGIKYLEIRVLDLNPYEKVSVSIEQLNFLQVFMLFCLFTESEFISVDELENINKNHHLVALFGRKEGLELYRYDNGSITLKDWSIDVFEKLDQIAALLDKTTGDARYQSSVEQEYKKILDSSLLPSARILQEMKKNSESFLDFGIRRAVLNKAI